MLNPTNEYNIFFQFCCSAKTLCEVQAKVPTAVPLPEFISTALSKSQSTESNLLNNSLARLSRLALQNDVSLYAKIQSICQANGLIQDDCQLIDYETRNLIPVRKVKGKYGGHLITVKVDNDFRFATANSDEKKYDKLIADWEKSVEVYKALYDVWVKNSETEKPISPIKPFIPYNYREVFYSDGDKIYKKFPTYSANPHSSANPQGDIGWIQLLPKEVQTIFGFARNDDEYTFPDIVEANGAIEHFNTLAEKKGFGNNYITMRLQMVQNGEVSNEYYIKLRSENLMAVSAPQRGYSSWFYHDYLYHFIGTLLTPQQSLRMAALFAQKHEVSPQSATLTARLTDLFDHSTTWAIRVASIVHLENNQNIADFFCFLNIGIGNESFIKRKIVEFAYFAYERNIDRDFKITRGCYYQDELEKHVNTIINKDPKGCIDPLKERVKEHLEAMRQVAAN